MINFSANLVRLWCSSVWSKASLAIVVRIFVDLINFYNQLTLSDYLDKDSSNQLVALRSKSEIP